LRWWNFPETSESQLHCTLSQWSTTSPQKRFLWLILAVVTRLGLALALVVVEVVEVAAVAVAAVEVEVEWAWAWAWAWAQARSTIQSFWAVLGV
jgi:hypothetical protein